MASVKTRLLTYNVLKGGEGREARIVEVIGTVRAVRSMFRGNSFEIGVGEAGAPSRSYATPNTAYL